MKKPKVIHHEFPKNQYYQEETKKDKIVIHHTVSGNSVEGDINWWEQTPERVATCVIIARDGTIHTLFRSKYWAHHLGVKMAVFRKVGLNPYGANKKLNQQSIGVELDSWGGLTRQGDKFCYKDKHLDPKNVIEYPHEIRGFKYYERYTDAQIESLKYLLLYWKKEYGIDICYNPDMWNFSVEALKGKPGVWSHTSYRPDKHDVHPQPELIKMLNSL